MLPRYKNSNKHPMNVIVSIYHFCWRTKLGSAILDFLFFGAWAGERIILESFWSLILCWNIFQTTLKNSSSGNINAKESVFVILCFDTKESVFFILCFVAWDFVVASEFQILICFACFCWFQMCWVGCQFSSTTKAK